jgi:prolyl-tRNA editing enzyme YbaK/EbsC (Cys-tRNA(Pro) deacylase)
MCEHHKLGVNAGTAAYSGRRPGDPPLKSRQQAAKLTRSLSLRASEERLAPDLSRVDLGPVPPIGGGRRDPVVIDSRLAERDSLVLEAGSHEESVRVPTSDLLRISEAEVADICVD